MKSFPESSEADSLEPLRIPAGRVNPTVLRAILALIGVTAIIAQIILMRELLVVFYGNELCLGLMLATWLLWTAAGSSIFGRMAARVHQPRRLMAGLQILVSLAFPCTIALVRASKGAFRPMPGEILGPGSMFLTSLVSLSLFCLTSGCLFAAGSRLYADEAGATTGAGTSAVYLLEAIGSGVGGIMGFLLIRCLDAFAIASLVCLLNLLAATTLLAGVAWQRRAIFAALLGAFALLVFPTLGPRFEMLSLARLWQGFHLVATRNSIYGNLAVVETGASRSLYENGLVVFTVPDPAAAEEAVHYALLQHRSPRSLLLVGGGVNGSLAQALQHPSLSRIDYVELNPSVIDLARRYFSKDWNPIEADARVHVHSTDGRLFLKTTGEMFDVIALNLPDPQTAQLNRFYTLEFLREAAARLNPNGVFSFQVRASEDYISPELAAFLQCINKTLRGAFPDVTVIPGETVHFFAATRTGILAADPQDLVSRLRLRGIQTSYVREYYIPFRMSPDRMLDLNQQIRPRADTPVNRDFAPIAYYFTVALWSSRFDQHYRRLFEAVSHLPFARMTTFAGLLLFTLAAALRWGFRAAVRSGVRGTERNYRTFSVLVARRCRASAGFCIAAAGFTLIGLEILLLLAFQAIYGYVYHQLAIVIAAFMVGLALGSWWAMRGAGASDASRVERQLIRTLAGLQTLTALSPLLLYVLLVLLAPIKGTLGLWMVSQVAFPVLAVLCGLLGGYQFPVGSRIFFAGVGGRTSSLGVLYGLDLVGAGVAAVMLSAYVVPVFGLLRTALFMGVVNLAPAALAGLSALEYRVPGN